MTPYKIIGAKCLDYSECLCEALLAEKFRKFDFPKSAVKVLLASKLKSIVCRLICVYMYLYLTLVVVYGLLEDHVYIHLLEIFQ